MATQECGTGKAETMKNLRTESVGTIFIQVRKACVHIIKFIDTMVVGHLPPRMFPGPKGWAFSDMWDFYLGQQKSTVP